MTVSDGSTGVWRTTSAPATRARATSVASTVRAGAATASAAQTGSATTASISTCAPSGREATPIVVRAGGSEGKKLP